MEELGPLKFDEMNVGYELAHDYLKKHSSGFRSLGFTEDYDTAEFTIDSFNIKIYYTDEQVFVDNDCEESEPWTEKTKKIRQLAKKVEENAELFCQLEALIRKIPKNDVMECDIKLIVQNLRYLSTCNDKFYVTQHMSMNEHTPLAALGYVGQQYLVREPRVLIKATPKTAVVCYLFTQLCHQVGLDLVKLSFFKHSDMKYQGFETGCTGVITSQSDVDSAVDVLLTSTTRYPWKLRRLLIQESVYDDVKKIFEWKCSLKRNNDVMDSQLKNLCTELFSYEDKMFLFDYAGELGDIGERTQTVVTVETYRTNKELLSMVAQNNPFCVSLWSNDVSEANEIAFGVDGTIVWVNDFGNFDGPPKASQAYFSIIKMDSGARDVAKCNSVDKLLKLRQDWLKVDVNERFDIVKGCLEKFTAAQTKSNEKICNFLSEFLKNLSEVSSSDTGNFVHVENGQMCIGIDRSLIIFLNGTGVRFEDLIWSLVLGNAILIDQCEYEGIFKMFVNEGLPVVFRPVTEMSFRGTFKVSQGHPLYITKVVRQNFGTIFAN